MKLESYKRPIDRHSIVWCKVCSSEVKSFTIDDKSVPMPMNLKDWQHRPCGAFDAMIFRYEGEPKEKIPTSGGFCNPAVVRPLPHCGNPSCDGTCLDPLCNGMPSPVKPSRIKTNPFWVFCGGVLVGSFVASLLGFFFW